MDSNIANIAMPGAFLVAIPVLIGVAVLIYSGLMNSMRRKIVRKLRFIELEIANFLLRELDKEKVDQVSEFICDKIDEVISEI